MGIIRQRKFAQGGWLNLGLRVKKSEEFEIDSSENIFLNEIIHECAHTHVPVRGAELVHGIFFDMTSFEPKYQISTEALEQYAES